MSIDSLTFALDDTHIISHSFWIIGCFLILFASTVVVMISRYFTAEEKKIHVFNAWRVFIFDVVKRPLFLLFSSYLVYIALDEITTRFSILLFSLPQDTLLNSAQYILRLIEFSAFFWIVLNTLNSGQRHLELWAIKNEKKTVGIILPMVSNSLKAMIIFLMISTLVPNLGLTGLSLEILEKSTKVALIIVIAWVLAQFINGAEKLIIRQYGTNLSADVNARKINTQVRLLKKIIFALGSVVMVAAIMMVFDTVKHFGAGLLTTAGIISAVGAFASQQSLGRVFSGLQIAFTQPIRIGDTVIIDNEFGQIEEITLSYIVIKLWDLQRLILPSDYFANRGLQNLSRFSTELLGTVFFYMDYALPIDDIRDKFQNILKDSKQWNSKVSNLDVTDIKQNCIEIRVLVSADNASLLWELRCEVREKLIQYIADKYPHCLPKTRVDNVPVS